MQEGEEAVARAGKGDSFSFPGSWEGKARGPWGGWLLLLSAHGDMAWLQGTEKFPQ